jgi:nucleotide-binding universal stress UspA family protein
MNTIILPVDFSDASLNAVRYAAAMSCHRAVDRIILLHSAEVTAFDSISQVGWGEVITEGWQRGAHLLEERSKDLIAECPQGMKVQTATSELPVLRAVREMIADVGAGLVVVGVEAGAEDGTVGEQVIGLARTSSVPVLVVPRGCRYGDAREAVVLARPGQDVAGLVDEDWMRAEFGTTTLSVYLVSEADPIKGALDHAKAIAAQLIVALPGSRSLFYRLTHRDLRNALAQNTEFPVLLLK